MQKWRFLPYKVYSSSQNMAIDEAIIIAHREGKVPPTLRFYGWNPATLSIGYFQKAKKEVDFERLKAAGVGFVRRMTGGRAVLHDQELTYSIIVSEDHPMMPSSISESYRLISQGLLEGFRRLGMNAYLSLPEYTEKSHSSSACFDSPSDYELVLEGKKVAGSAQTRQRGVILQHGSILLDMDEDLLFDVLRFPSERVKERLKQNFADKAVAINRLREKPVSIMQAVTAFYQGFCRGMGLQFEEAELTDYEKQLADELVQKRYGSEEWNLKR
ncbi:biotin/lipoate A/B protein ligase family protein [Paenactinomyces guangxiensis]|uniref:Lipoate--protein ligase family protein n=1 Tax=Paenactinomyces guangxiensis TaxID=1490290 RepID=A0A7W2A7V7_9BACL|nr:biotin/lipoate A/B protein ligase family protein [Paenactinomyces guangxiensis]MBA4494941.1 lipoate--protein ligase family protein [Paenactinomyces guangxiensis]MBH8592024.1 lipoate--protein ligase family protein [Paenactinomyces guangxiensis]